MGITNSDIHDDHPAVNDFVESAFAQIKEGKQN
ncbi:hypothetical protein HDF25_001184 [Pedobacter cryoconitis]|uniref:Transposase n=1 Tax=Pedobacter cryoconitis TaxID=188932 RepID=A0A7X0J1E4_9SPHI|nr:hypothetical protein [Pedobacter cryoconitis]